MSTAHKRKLDFDTTQDRLANELERSVETFHAALGDYHGTQKRIKLDLSDARTQELRAALLQWTHTSPDVLDIVLQYVRGSSVCNRDKWYCDVCGTQCVDCEHALWCSDFDAFGGLGTHFGDCPQCGETGPRCFDCQIQHMQDCLDDV